LLFYADLANNTSPKLGVAIAAINLAMVALFLMIYLALLFFKLVKAIYKC